jgi:hypothetical protein
VEVPEGSPRPPGHVHSVWATRPDALTTEGPPGDLIVHEVKNLVCEVRRTLSYPRKHETVRLTASGPRVRFGEHKGGAPGLFGIIILEGLAEGSLAHVPLAVELEKMWACVAGVQGGHSKHSR